MTQITRSFKTSPETLLQNVRRACGKLGFSIVKDDALTRRLVISTGWSAFSWGESINVIVTLQGDESVLTLESKAKVWFNLSGEDRADRDAKAILEELEKP